MFDFSNVPFFDNHTHLIDVDHAKHALYTSREVKPVDLTLEFLHGRRESAPEAETGDRGISHRQALTLESVGVVKTLVHHMAQFLGCEETLTAVTAARNARTREDVAGYARALYADQHIFAEMIDDGAPIDGPLLACFPCQKLRLFQMDPLLRRLLKECESYPTMLERFSASVTQAIGEGFIGVKCHVLEVVTCPPRVVRQAEAEAAYAQAVAGETQGFDTVYLAVLSHAMLLCQELDVPIHIHTGCTGNPNDLMPVTCHPFRLVPFLETPVFYRTTVVMLHAGFPHVRDAAMLTHGFPNLWVDMSWVLPWISLNFEQCLLEVLGVAPHAKVMLGSGQHGIPELVWLSAKVAKSALASVMKRLVETDMLSVAQAQEAAEMLLYKNAARLYKLTVPGENL